MTLYIINGPNINMLGIREKTIYGSDTYDSLLAFLHQTAETLGITIECFQSNHEGALVDIIQSAYGKADGIVINPAAYTHTSVAILDALKAVQIPAVEVHLSDIAEREAFRHVSYASMACVKQIKGLGFEGYAEAMRFLVETLEA